MTQQNDTANSGPVMQCWRTPVTEVLRSFAGEHPLSLSDEANYTLSEVDLTRLASNHCVDGSICVCCDTARVKPAQKSQALDYQRKRLFVCL